MERHLLNSRTTISQCYHVVQETGAEGLSLIDVERKLGISKLMARMLLKTLQKLDLIVSVSSDDARRRFNRSVNRVVFGRYLVKFLLRYLDFSFFSPQILFQRLLRGH